MSGPITPDRRPDGRVLAAVRRLGLRIDPADPSFPRGPAGAGEAGALLHALTVGETCFHRYPEQFDVFVATLLRPAAIAGRPLRVLSAGCSTGEEAYTLAMTIREVVPAATGRVTIDAFDVNPEAIARARAGRYAPWALRETPRSARERWFRAEDGEFVVDAGLRGLVRFHERNLVEDDPAFWAEHAWDAIFCRNVLMYLTPTAARAVVARVARSLAPGGLLFLGHAESLRGERGGLELRLTRNACFYVRPHAEPAAVARPSPESPPAEPLRVAPLSAVYALLREERFRAAVDALAGRPCADPDEALALAVAHLGAGNLDAAERVATGLRSRAPRSAGAHCVLALVQESRGDPGAAMAHHQAAIRLDPGFAMPRLHLGRLARRAGLHATARRELRRALSLLSLEDDARIVQYGGGFGREALRTLCRDELRACEAA